MSSPAYRISKLWDLREIPLLRELIRLDVTALKAERRHGGPFTIDDLHAEMMKAHNRWARRNGIVLTRR